MKISTSRFGTIEVQEEQIIRVPSGLIGFPDSKRYTLLEHKKDSHFFWFQSVEDESLAFVLMDPLLFKPDYEIEISPEEMRDLELMEGTNGLKTFVIINISPNTSHQVTANLLGPLLINVKKRKAKQIVLHRSPYSHRHPISSN